MRKVVKEQTETISIEQITDDSIVGIEWASGARAIVIYKGDSFVGLNNDCKSIGRAWSANTIKEYIEKASSITFQFDSVKECLKWMSE